MSKLWTGCPKLSHTTLIGLNYEVFKQRPVRILTRSCDRDEFGSNNLESVQIIRIFILCRGRNYGKPPCHYDGGGYFFDLEIKKKKVPTTIKPEIFFGNFPKGS